MYSFSLFALPCKASLSLGTLIYSFIKLDRNSCADSTGISSITSSFSFASTNLFVSFKVERVLIDNKTDTIAKKSIPKINDHINKAVLLDVSFLTWLFSFFGLSICSLFPLTLLFFNLSLILFLHPFQYIL